MRTLPSPTIVVVHHVDEHLMKGLAVSIGTLSHLVFGCRHDLDHVLLLRPPDQLQLIRGPTFESASTQSVVSCDPRISGGRRSGASLSCFVCEPYRLWHETFGEPSTWALENFSWLRAPNTTNTRFPTDAPLNTWPGVCRFIAPTTTRRYKFTPEKDEPAPLAPDDLHRLMYSTERPSGGAGHSALCFRSACRKN